MPPVLERLAALVLLSDPNGAANGAPYQLAVSRQLSVSHHVPQSCPPAHREIQLQPNLSYAAPAAAAVAVALVLAHARAHRA